MESKKPKNIYTESEKPLFPWLSLTNLQQIDILLRESQDQIIAIFKHSVRCSISKMVLMNFEQEWNFSQTVTFYYLDLITHRDISNAISESLGVEHQSPQLIVVYKGKVIYQESHDNISAKTLEETIESLEA